MFELKKNEKGFALIEFIIALPLIILLLYGFGQTTMKTFETSNNHAADYELEVEAQEVLTQIVQDARTASSVTKFAHSNTIYSQNDTLIIKYHAIKYDAGKIIDVIDTRVYVVSDSFKLNAKRQNDNHYLNPITGGNTFGDTVIRKLKYSKPTDKVLYITLEMESLRTNQRINLSTAVYMPACEEMKGF